MSVLIDAIKKVPNLLACFFLIALYTSCATREVSVNRKADMLTSGHHYRFVEFWLTTGNSGIKLTKQNNIALSSTANDYDNIEVDPSQKYQSIDGFGFTLTGGSVQTINKLSPTVKEALLQELFSPTAQGISISYLRLSIGASDLNNEVFSYDDIPAGQIDVNLDSFNIKKDQALIDLLKKILSINPDIQVIATPWSAPLWMKDNGLSIGGSLKPEYYGVYANYFVKYIRAMEAQGININAITPQNEPLHGGNNPSMVMTAEQQKEFIKNYIGPLFKKENLNTKIIIYDHNADNLEYPNDILSDNDASSFIDGSAFHLYAGSIHGLGIIHSRFPKKNIYFTEQWTSSMGDFSEDLIWHSKQVIVGSLRNWSKVVLEWNLSNDENFRPHTDGGCLTCRGALTIYDNDTIIRNVAYYIIGHASKFIPRKSVRISSSQLSDLSTVAFDTGDKIVLLIVNESSKQRFFNIKVYGDYAPSRIPAKSVGTLIFLK